jgi:hypothetical protein
LLVDISALKYRVCNTLIYVLGINMTSVFPDKSMRVNAQRCANESDKSVASSLRGLAWNESIFDVVMVMR